ncbi:hypothetical protein QMA56_02900 [Leuconostoc falkenbergense]|uniref:hypothetical protein n=1 Tax=Leuconostoc falkenbergense TaxID=2766470 RepID=UPI0024ACE79F|nr:hypothetical protein [Leuconostoc falkenbergense]MDI6666654.1 hypothetical protein [Leuconostoc falkenbergense]
MTKIRQKIWVDGQIPQSGIEIPTYMRQYFNKSTNGSHGVLNYVGFHLTNSELNIMLPKNSEWSNSVSVDVINILIDSLKDNRDSKSGDSETVSGITTNDLFSVVEWLIQDFRSNGIFAINQTQWNKRKGKINWETTIRKATPFVQDNNLVLINLFRKKRISELDEVSKIHAFVMQQIADQFGILFHGFSFKSRLTPIDLNDTVKLKRVLNKTFTMTNIRREKMLILNLLKYLDLIDSKQFELSIVTMEFHVLFEKSFKFFIGDQEELHTPAAIPKARWSLELPGREPIIAKNKQIPDALVIRHGQKCQYLDIYDSKYYDLTYYKNINQSSKIFNAPADWYSVGKQFFYEYSYNRLAISNKLEQGENYFVFPWPVGIKKMLPAGHVDIIVGDGQSRHIQLLLVDPIELLRVFATRNVS